MLLLKYPTKLTSIECKWLSGFFLIYIAFKDPDLLCCTAGKESCHTPIGKENQNLPVLACPEPGVESCRGPLVVAAAAEHPAHLRPCFYYTVRHPENTREFSTLQ